LTDAIRQKLIRAAMSARKFAYAPYSDFSVGAALLTTDGTLVSACNVENASYGLAVCAERAAICKAISEGYREFTAIAIAASPLASPCGACRQFIAEFGSEIEVISVDSNDPGTSKSWLSKALLPDRFAFR
jgi:cytidine deaminase